MAPSWIYRSTHAFIAAHTVSFFVVCHKLAHVGVAIRVLETTIAPPAFGSQRVGPCASIDTGSKQCMNGCEFWIVGIKMGRQSVWTVSHLVVLPLASVDIVVGPAQRTEAVLLVALPRASVHC
jgi:hypothetical protein